MKPHDINKLLVLFAVPEVNSFIQPANKYKILPVKELTQSALCVQNVTINSCKKILY